MFINWLLHTFVISNFLKHILAYLKVKVNLSIYSYVHLHELCRSKGVGALHFISLRMCSDVCVYVYLQTSALLHLVTVNSTLQKELFTMSRISRLKLHRFFRTHKLYRFKQICIHVGKYLYASKYFFCFFNIYLK